MKKEDLITAFTMKVNGYKTEAISKQLGIEAATLNKALHNVISKKSKV